MAIPCVRVQEMDKTFPENSSMSFKDTIAIPEFLKMRTLDVEYNDS